MTTNEYVNLILSNATPTQFDRATSARNRVALDQWAQATHIFNAGFFETGSWSHGTAVRGFSDVDYFLVMCGQCPASSGRVLQMVSANLAARHGTADVQINRPAVRVQLDENSPDIEIVPAYRAPYSDDYFIPDPNGTGWIRSNPKKHLAYVNKARDAQSDAKRFIRLVKTWNHWRGVGLSSFYLEMRAAKHLLDHPPLSLFVHFTWLLETLTKNGLASMNDPSQFQGRRIDPCPPDHHDAVAERVGIYAKAARRALDADREGHDASARVWLDLLFKND